MPSAVVFGTAITYKYYQINADLSLKQKATTLVVRFTKKCPLANTVHVQFYEISANLSSTFTYPVREP